MWVMSRVARWKPIRKREGAAALVPLLLCEAHSARLDGIAAQHHRAALLRKEQGSNQSAPKSALHLMLQVRTGAAEDPRGAISPTSPRMAFGLGL